MFTTVLVKTINFQWFAKEMGSDVHTNLLITATVKYHDRVVH